MEDNEADRGAERAAEGAQRGTVYLVGAGPGDPRLITERGAALLSTADVVLHDELVDPSLLARARPGAAIVAVGKRGDSPPDKRAKQDEIDAALVAHARAKKSVVRLKGGDPFLFGRGSEEVEALVRAHIPFEVVPGVTSPLAAAAYAGMSLTHRDLASSVVLVSATTRGGELFDFAELAGCRGTIAVMMGVKRLEEIAKALVDRSGRPATTPAAIIENGTLPCQRVVTGTLANIAERGCAAHVVAPALIVVGSVVALRETARWFDARPLFGKTVLVTRAPHQASAASTLLRARGAEPVAIATIEIVPRRDDAAVARAIGELATTDVIAFTSENAVAAFFDALDGAKRDARAIGTARVASVGRATSRALAVRGIRADIEPETSNADALAAAILGDLSARWGAPTGRRVLFPRASKGREVLPDRLREHGVSVDVVPVYETVPAGDQARNQLRTMLEDRRIDVVLATSPSTIANLAALLGEASQALLGGTLIAAIGDVTADAVRALGLDVAILAKESTLVALVAAIETHFAEASGGQSDRGL